MVVYSLGTVIWLLVVAPPPHILYKRLPAIFSFGLNESQVCLLLTGLHMPSGWFPQFPLVLLCLPGLFFQWSHHFKQDPSPLHLFLTLCYAALSMPFCHKSFRKGRHEQMTSGYLSDHETKMHHHEMVQQQISLESQDSRMCYLTSSEVSLKEEDRASLSLPVPLIFDLIMNGFLFCRCQMTRGCR